MRVGLAVLLAVAVVVVPSTVGGYPAAQAQASVAVEIRDDIFLPPTIAVAPGGRITWTNRGRNVHNVIAGDASFASATLQPGDSFAQAFPKSGAFPYFCSFHGARGGVGQSGVVLVGQEADEYRQQDLSRIRSSTRTYPGRAPERPVGGQTIRVPADAPTIQAAVDGARPGDLVFVAPGIYHEAVLVTTPHLTIRGEDRNGVILDGRFDAQMRNGIAVFGADGVAIENMTARHYQLNGFYWRSVWGYRGSYLTAYNNGDYGLYAFDAGVGRFDHSWASGHPDSGFYIGQCDPCNAVIEHVVARDNAIGYSGTNASGGIVIRDSEWTDNMVGIVPSTLDSEALPPQRDIAIVRNVVRRNGNRDAPVLGRIYALFGNGIVLLGGSRNEVAHNLVEDHPHAGIAVAPSLDEHLWLPGGNRIHDNVIRRSGLADLALIAPVAGGNCFAANRATTTLPPALEQTYGCGSPLAALGGGDVGLFLNGMGQYLRGERAPPGGDWRTRPAPPPQPPMPDVRARPDPAGPIEPIDVEADLARPGPFEFAEGARTVAGGNGLLLLHGYVVPALFLATVVTTLRRSARPRLLHGRRALLGLAGLYVLAAVAIFVTAYLR